MTDEPTVQVEPTEPMTTEPTKTTATKVMEVLWRSLQAVEGWVSKYPRAALITMVTISILGVVF